MHIHSHKKKKMEIIIIIIILMHPQKNMQYSPIYLGLYHLPQEALYHFASSIR